MSRPQPLLSFGAALLLTLALVACGAPDAATAPDTAGAPTGTTPTAPPIPPAPVDPPPTTDPPPTEVPPPQPLPKPPPGTSATPQNASVRVTVGVPAGMNTAPFDVARQLTVPPGFAIDVYARVPGARFMALLPSGDLLVSQPFSGKVVRVSGTGANQKVTDALSGLNRPHDLVPATVGGQLYLYVSESNTVSRYPLNTDGTLGARQAIVTGLPDDSLPELKGAYNHALKNIALAGDTLYVAIASASNADPADLEANPKRGAIYAYPAGTPNQAATAGTLYAQGIRNAEGLALSPQGDLWVVVNNRDETAYPFHTDFDGDGQDDYGKVLPAYVDNHPPEEFIRVKQNGNYGWPFCNPNPDTGLVDMPFDRDVQTNADGAKLDCSTADRITQGIQAHSAPLGVSFWTGDRAPAAYKNGAVAAYHGSWNRTSFSGHKVAYFPWAAGRPGKELDLVTGWVTDPVAKQRWGRPVDAIPAPDGSLLISDDDSGAVYRLYLKK